MFTTNTYLSVDVRTLSKSDAEILAEGFNEHGYPLDLEFLILQIGTFDANGNFVVEETLIFDGNTRRLALESCPGIEMIPCKVLETDASM